MSKEPRRCDRQAADELANRATDLLDALERETKHGRIVANYKPTIQRAERALDNFRASCAACPAANRRRDPA